MIGCFEQGIFRDQILEGQVPLLHLTIAEVTLHAIAVVSD
jgi:hypothetical protein